MDNTKLPRPETPAYYEFLEWLVPYLESKLPISIYGLTYYNFGFNWVVDGKIRSYAYQAPCNVDLDVLCILLKEDLYQTYLNQKVKNG